MQAEVAKKDLLAKGAIETNPDFMMKIKPNYLRISAAPAKVGAKKGAGKK